MCGWGVHVCVLHMHSEVNAHRRMFIYSPPSLLPHFGVCTAAVRALLDAGYEAMLVEVFQTDRRQLG